MFVVPCEYSFVTGHKSIHSAPSACSYSIALPMQRLLSRNTESFEKPSKPCHVGIHWIALVLPCVYQYFSRHVLRLVCSLFPLYYFHILIEIKE